MQYPPSEDEYKTPGASPRHTSRARVSERPFYHDEHPQVPIAKRASRSRYVEHRRREEQQTQPSQAMVLEGVARKPKRRVEPALSLSQTLASRDRKRSEPLKTPTEQVVVARRPVRMTMTGQLGITPPKKQQPASSHTLLYTSGLLLFLGVLITVSAFFWINSRSKISLFQSDIMASIDEQLGAQRPAPPIHGRSAYLYDVKAGKELLAINAKLRLPILSTTKMMTALLVAENEKNFDRQVKIEGQIIDDMNTQLSPDSSLMGIRRGETYTIRELMYGLMLVSGNDAAIVLADAISGTVPKFVDRMNQRARELGLVDTNFVNPHGLLDPDHYSSARDLAILGNVSLNHPIVHEFTLARTYKMTANALRHGYDMFNGNQFLWWYPGADGGKPGSDGMGNRVQVVTVTKQGRQLVGVVISTKDWWTDMRNIMNFGFNDFSWVSPRDYVTKQFIPYASLYGNFESDKQENTISLPNNGGRYYYYTGYMVAPPILSYFDQQGGLKKLGYPQGSPVPGENSISQHFNNGEVRCDTQTKTCETVSQAS